MASCVDAERLHRRKLGLIRRAALDRGAQRLGGDGQARRLVVGALGRMRGIFGERFHRAFQRRDPVRQRVEIALLPVRLARDLGGHLAGCLARGFMLLADASFAA